MNKLYWCLLLMLASGCSTLTKTQLAGVKQFAVAGSKFSAYPSKIITGLGEIRMRRGVYYANSLDNPKLHLEELDNIYDFRKDEEAVSAKVDVTFRIIDKYAESLLLLSSVEYETNLQAQAATFGTDLDSLTTLYNSLDNVKRVPTGIGSAIGQLIASGGRQFIRRKQAKEIKKFVPAADTIISVMTGNLLEFLQSSNIRELIENEEAGITSNYLSYLRQIKTLSSISSPRDTSFLLLNTKSAISSDLDYLQMKANLDKVKKLQSLTISATRKLRAAHQKLLSVIQIRRTLKTSIPEIQSLYNDIIEIKKAVDQIEKPRSTSDNSGN